MSQIDQGAPDRQSPRLRSTHCAICECEGAATVRWPANLEPDAFSSRIFSARRLPDRVHYRMVVCDNCRLVRSDPVADEDLLAALYAESTFDYGGEVRWIRMTYARALRRLEARLGRRDALLEIGCGNGFFLEHASARGWRTVRGVEPSGDAAAKAPRALRDAIVQSVMRGDLFAPESFDAICMFQVLDHISDPLTMLRDCFTALRPGGYVLALNHNVDAVSARLLGERSPIVDIEHTYLYSPTTMRRLFAKAGFEDASVSSVRNTYSLSYLLQLTPLPDPVKQALLPGLGSRALGRLRLTLPLGNLLLIAQRPA